MEVVNNLPGWAERHKKIGRPTLTEVYQKLKRKYEPRFTKQDIEDMWKEALEEKEIYNHIPVILKPYEAVGGYVDSTHYPEGSSYLIIQES